ncbi:uncharacterized protein LOC131001020 [Salvia miltiorrhiza]|uniref:uncharacterized protein LOC131001020 n=1 Tax=Salvia miltiorrhiza TaxID=226208 RepID=UPI0025AC56BE|nr:uncharacterized protein LOC131001020 [Salvia miltiorrhiza]
MERDSLQKKPGLLRWRTSKIWRGKAWRSRDITTRTMMDREDEFVELYHGHHSGYSLQHESDVNNNDQYFTKVTVITLQLAGRLDGSFVYSFSFLSFKLCYLQNDF